MKNYPWNLSPHVISGAVGKMNRGRRRLQHQGADEEVPWYTLLVLESGSLVLRDHQGHTHTRKEACAILLEPCSRWQIDLPPLSEYCWVDFGLTSEERVHREEDRHGWRYVQRHPQPVMMDLFGVEAPLILEMTLYQSSLHLCREVNGLWWRGGQSLLRAHCRLYNWLLEFLRCYDPEEREREEVFPEASEEVRGLIRIAERQLEQRFTTRIWAEMAGMSRTKLHQCFQAELGMSSGDVLDRIRLIRAQNSLLGGASVGLAAKDCGFQSRSSFSSWFHRKTGSSPSLWREDHGHVPLDASRPGSGG